MEVIKLEWHCGNTLVAAKIYLPPKPSQVIRTPLPAKKKTLAENC